MAAHLWHGRMYTCAHRHMVPCPLVSCTRTHHMHISSTWRTSYAIWAQGADFPTLSLASFLPPTRTVAEMYGVWFSCGGTVGGMANHHSRLARSGRLVIVRATTLGVLADSQDSSVWFRVAGAQLPSARGCWPDRQVGQRTPLSTLVRSLVCSFARSFTRGCSFVRPFARSLVRLMAYPGRVWRRPRPCHQRHEGAGIPPITAQDTALMITRQS